MDTVIPKIFSFTTGLTTRNGKRLHSSGKIHHAISMAIFKSKLLVITRG